MRLLLTVCLIAASVIACTGGSETSQSPGAPASSVSGGTQPSEAWSREALDVQPEMALLKHRTPATTGHTPGTTPWTPLDAAVEAGEASSPGALLMAVIASQHWADILGDAVWEQTTRVLVDGNAAATGVVLQWGLLDDAVAGRDFRVSMRRAADMWRVERVERRFHCRRGVSAQGQCR